MSKSNEYDVAGRKLEIGDKVSFVYKTYLKIGYIKRFTKACIVVETDSYPKEKLIRDVNTKVTLVSKNNKSVFLKHCE